MSEPSQSRNGEAPLTDFEKWMDAKRPWWRQWGREDQAACSQLQVAEMMSEAWHAAANTVEGLRSERPRSEVRYLRVPFYDKRIGNGDDFSGDAWLRWTAVGQRPEDEARTNERPEGTDRV